VIDPKPILAAKAPLTLANCPEGLQPWLMADLARAVAPARAVFVAEDEGQARSLADAAQFFAPDLETVQFPAWDCLPYDRASPSARSSADRLAGLARLTHKPAGPQLLVTTLNALTQRVLTPERIKAATRAIKARDAMDRDQLSALLSANGYVRVDTVVEAGEYAVRGGLIDVFPAGERTPLRLDFFGDEIETLRRFEIGTQRTIETAPGFTLLPVSEALLDEASIRRFRQGYVAAFGTGATADPLYEAVSEGRRMAGMEHYLPLFEERLATLFDYLGPKDVIVRDASALDSARRRFETLADYFQNREAMLASTRGGYRPLPPERLYLGAAEWGAAVKAHRAHITSPFDSEGAHVHDLKARPPRDFAPERAANANVYDAVVGHIAAERKAKRRTILATYSRGARDRLTGLLADHGLEKAADAESWQGAQGLAADGRTPLMVVALDHGFTLGNISVLTEQDMLGERLVRRRRNRKADAFLAEMATLTPGDYVVHREHGIGRFEGLEPLEIAGASHDCVRLAYDGGTLFVPVENIDVLSRYGAETDGVSLDKIGGAAWQGRKARMKERIKEIADQLLKTAAERAQKQADAMVPDPHAYAEFVDRFPYVETDDQLKAVDDVLADLASGKPMDRLVCGDVGFGKTEVALRAAFVSAMQGMQVAIVAPTTLLARQHYANFRDRFQGFPVQVRQLSRLVTAAEAKQARDGLADGTVDIVVGTHAILSKTVTFDRLGLVVVDEEQRFGVAAKEKLKALKTDVHVLTLTATPIPRTLQMAMSGLRELSIIATPPVDRLAVRTYVSPWDPAVLREALLRERARGGQTFMVTPRIADMPDLEEFLHKHVPEVKPISAHGQMAPAEVEDRMSAFYDRRYDVLLSTSIIESGIDIPTANTLIVHRADMFGLAQLYQIRGRVGRSKARAYAYLTTPDDAPITEAADKRLKVLSSLDSLGAGFQLASHDLDIRGAGNLLGDEQSGHIREIGFELYQEMLEEAINTAKAGASGEPLPQEEFSPQITVDATILIPDSYVSDLNLRMALYRRLNEVQGKAALESFAAELIDRFGPLPEEAKNLLAVYEIKLFLKRAGVAKLDAGPKGALVAFWGDTPPNPDGVMRFVARLHGTARLRPDSKLFVERAWEASEARLPGALHLAKVLAKLAKGEAEVAAVQVPEPKKAQAQVGVFRAKKVGR